VKHLGSAVWDCEVWGLRLRAYDLWFRIEGIASRDSGVQLRMYGLEFRIQG